MDILETIEKVKGPLYKFVELYPFKDLEGEITLNDWLNCFVKRAFESHLTNNIGNFKILQNLVKGLYEFRFYLIGRLRYMKGERKCGLHALLDDGGRFLIDLIKPLSRFRDHTDPDYEKDLSKAKHCVMFNEDICKKFKTSYITGEFFLKADLLLHGKQGRDQPTLAKGLELEHLRTPGFLARRIFHFMKPLSFSSFEVALLYLAEFMGLSLWFDSYLTSIAKAESTSVPKLLDCDLTTFEWRYLAVIHMQLLIRELSRKTQ